MAITELWRKQHKFQTKSKQLIVGEPKTITTGPRKGEIRYPKDKAAGVAIILSKRIQQKVLQFGSEGERVCWVRLRGPTCNLFVIAVYMPHRARIQPSQDQTLADIQEVLKDVPPRDCVCMLGDFNEQLPSNVEGATGAWTGGTASANANRMLDLLRMNNLTAINTLFPPKKRQSVCTFLQTKQRGSSMDTANDLGRYVGREVKVKYKKAWIEGIVQDVDASSDEPTWIIRYDDGYVERCKLSRLRKILIHVETAKEARQLDYIFVSRRWVSCISNCRVRWGPSIHRDIHGNKNDHGLVESTWRWRIRSVQPVPAKDFGVLSNTVLDDEGPPQPSPELTQFGEAVSLKLQELGHTGTEDATTMYSNLCASIKFAIDTVLPTVPKHKGIKREVSEDTQQLFEKRQQMHRCNQQQHDNMQSAIKESCLQDYVKWVEGHGSKMAEANGRGDTRAIYKSVKTLAEKQDKPAKNLRTDGEDNILQCVKDKTARWFGFLKGKFAATEAEA